MSGSDGVFVIDKPAGLTSQQAVSRLRHALGARKAGHAGTLDPMATGVLVVGVGRATRLLGHIAGTRKQYEATIRLGQGTNTDDAEGEPVGPVVDATLLTDEAVAAAVASLTGDISQVPSAYSAVKVDGRRAYALARAGQSVELQPRHVNVSRFEVLTRRDTSPFADISVVVDCSTGTYIRALARDLGTALGTGGHLTALRRTRVGVFGIDAAVALEDAEWADMTGIDDVARKVFAGFDADTATAADVTHGRPIEWVLPDDPTAVFGPDGRFLALYRQDGGRAVPVAVFCGGDE